MLILAVAGAAQLPRIADKPSGHHFAYVDARFIFTLELYNERTPILNFVNITDEQHLLRPADIELVAEGRRYRVKFLSVDTGAGQDQVLVPSIKMHPRSSFGILLKGDFEGLKSLDRVAIRFEREVYELAALSPLDFEFLVQKINKVNLNSPNIEEDYSILGIEHLGKRTLRTRLIR